MPKMLGCEDTDNDSYAAYPVPIGLSHWVGEVRGYVRMPMADTALGMQCMQYSHLQGKDAHFNAWGI
jgi:hypothetical protein